MEMKYEQLFAKMYMAEKFQGGVERFIELMTKIRKNLDESDRLFSESDNPKKIGGLQDKWNAITTADVITNNQIQEFVGLSERKLETAQKCYQSYLDGDE